MPRWEPIEDILAAAARWKQTCFLEDGSVFSAERLWTAENVAYLDRFYAQTLNEGEGDFWSKLERQLAPAPSSAKKLAAEMFWVMYLPVSKDSMTAETKRLQIRRVWEWSNEIFPLSTDAPEFGSVLELGILRPGVSYNTGRWREFLFFVQLLQDFKARDQQQRLAILSDPWKAAEWLDGVEGSNGRQLRHILLYFLFPDQFEPIATGRDKRVIVQAFRARAGGDPTQVNYKDRIVVDREVARIREVLGKEYGDPNINFYADPLVQLWRPDETKPNPQPDPDSIEKWYSDTFGNQRVWAIAAGEAGRLWPDFQRENVIAIGWDYLGDLTEYESREDLTAAIAEERGGGVNPYNDSLACWQFVHELDVGDFVFVKRGRTELLGWGVIQSGYRYEADRAEYDHVRSVKWLKTGRWQADPARTITLKTLTDFSRPLYKQWLQYAWLLSGMDTRPEPGPGPGPGPDPAYTTKDACVDLFLSPDQFGGILDTLARRRNIILQGAPGVGKTFMARRLAYALIQYKRPEQVQMVQFHQSYSYEDFVQGWRPSGDGGFVLQNGVFHRFCEKARNDLNNTYVFIIDEINRGNLSKVFGELMMLIEADKRGEEYAVPLTYSPDERFSVPPNVFLVGMMNTADRSLALVDYALRRRFGFVTLDAAFATDMFSDNLTNRGASGDLTRKIVERFRALNEEIRQDRTLGRGFEIGHSYFVPQESDESVDDAWYEAIIRNEIRPLLEEYWFDDQEKAQLAVNRLLQ